MTAITFYPIGTTKRIEGMSYQTRYRVMLGEQETSIVMNRSSREMAGKYTLDIVRGSYGVSIQDAAFDNCEEVQEYLEDIFRRPFKTEETRNGVALIQV